METLSCTFDNRLHHDPTFVKRLKILHLIQKGNTTQI